MWKILQSCAFWAEKMVHSVFSVTLTAFHRIPPQNDHRSKIPDMHISAAEMKT